MSGEREIEKPLVRAKKSALIARGKLPPEPQLIEINITIAFTLRAKEVPSVKEVCDSMEVRGVLADAVLRVTKVEAKYDWESK